MDDGALWELFVEMSGRFSNRGLIFNVRVSKCVLCKLLSQIVLMISLPPLFCESDFHSVRSITAMDLLNSGYGATRIVRSSCS